MDDLISRQAAISAVNTALFPKVNTAKDAEKALLNLPSAQPKRGRWEEREWFTNDECPIDEWQIERCSECNKYLTTPYRYTFFHHNYCPYCGAKMYDPCGDCQEFSCDYCPNKPSKNGW